MGGVYSRRIVDAYMDFESSSCSPWSSGLEFPVYPFHELVLSRDDVTGTGRWRSTLSTKPASKKCGRVCVRM